MRDCVMIEISIRSAHHRSPQITPGCRRAADWRWWCVVAGARRAMELLCQPSPRQLAAAAAAGDQGPAVVNRWVAVNSPAAAGVN